MDKITLMLPILNENVHGRERKSSIEIETERKQEREREKGNSKIEIFGISYKIPRSTYSGF